MEEAPKKVLYIEDDKYIGAIFRKKLEDIGYEVTHVMEGEIAQKMIDNGDEVAGMNIILLDLMLPGMDGFELLRSIKASEQLKNIPVVVLSNIDGEDQRKKAESLGVADYLVKAHHTTDQIADCVYKVIHSNPSDK